MSKIRLAIAGVGNCASSLVQGVEYYRHAEPGDDVPGLMHVTLGGYHVSDVEFVAAFDVDATKVGLDLGKAVFAGQNNTIRFAQVGDVGVQVQRGPTFDGLGKYYKETIDESPALREAGRVHENDDIELLHLGEELLEAQGRIRQVEPVHG